MIANVSASDVSGDLVVISDTEDVEEPDIPDLYFGDDNNITSENIGRFFPGGSLDSNYSNSVLNFKGEFRDLGVLELSQSNVTVIGEGCVFYNTVFNIIGNDVYLSNLTFLLNESFYDSEGSAIFIQGDNVTINNIYINYTASYDAEAYGIYSYGTSRNPNDGLTIINSTINFVGQDFGEDVYTYAIRLDYSPNALIANNAINSKLILKPVNFQGGRSASDSDYSLTISASYCDNLIFIGNNVTSDAIGRSLGYPTLDCFFMWGCDDSYILNNSFLLTDFYTYYGVDNYLYCLDIYSTENLIIAYNNISVMTTGGRLSAGTAYPIQLTGPLSNVTIVYNDLYSISNGPNIGIYSTNTGGNTGLFIAYNKINITGLAGEDNWALVSGIELQDSNDLVMNNEIEVHSIDEVNETSNIYGISYAQLLDEEHKFDIINNTVLSDGFYAVYLLSAVNSTIIHNTLLSNQENIENSYAGYKKGPGSHIMEMSYNNKVYNAFDYFAAIANDIDSGYVFNYSAVENDQELSNIINAGGINGKNIFNIPDFNPLITEKNIRHHTNGGAAANFNDDGVDDGSTSGNGGDDSSNYNNGNMSDSSNPENGQNSDDVELLDLPDGDNGYVVDYNYHPRTPSKTEENNHSTSSNPNNSNYTQKDSLNLLNELVNYLNSNTEGGNQKVPSYGGRTISNNESYTSPSFEGDESSVSDSKSSEAPNANDGSGLSSNDEASESSQKSAYELNNVVKKIEDNIALAIVLIILCLICLVIGYKRQNSD